MISAKLQIAMLIAVGLYFLIVLKLLRRKTLNLKYTLLWLASGAIMLMLAVFPKILGWFAALVGIYDPTNALFAFVFFCVVIILLSITAIVSKLNEKSKQIIQSIALLEKRVRELESESDLMQNQKRKS
ncbi:DUF2304 domain-containing protein [Oscillospiraceae bacterium 50-16]